MENTQIERDINGIAQYIEELEDRVYELETENNDLQHEIDELNNRE